MTAPTTTPVRKTRPKSRRAVIALRREALTQLLDLPPDLRVTWVWTTEDPSAINLAVMGESLAEVDDDLYAPLLEGALERCNLVGPDGKLYVRWGWQAEPRQDPYRQALEAIVRLGERHDAPEVEELLHLARRALGAAA